MKSRGLRPRGQGLVVAVLVVLLVVAAGLVVMQKWPGLAWWAVGGAAGAAAFLGGVGPLWQRWREQRAADAGVVRRSVRTADKTVAELSLDSLGVHKAVVEVPYLPRVAKEREIADHLCARRPVLIVGPSMVGKTRLAAAVVGQVLADKPLLVPDTPTALNDLDEANIVPSDRVIWLDDLERFFAGDGISAGLVRRLAESNWLVATLQAYQWDRFQPRDQLRPLGWDVLRLFELVTLDRERDRPTDEDLRRAVPDEDIRERIAQTGIGEYVGAAQYVRDQLTVHADPLGYALVAGAADWSLVGIFRPVPAGLLPRLAAARLTARRRAELEDTDKYRAALGWATREINSTVSLLEPGDGTYRVYDYALEQLATTDRTVPAATWQLAVDEADADELVSVGFLAYAYHDIPDIAEQAWRKAATLGQAVAMVDLGTLLREREELPQAEHWYRRAIDTGDDAVTIAEYNLGVLLHERGELAEAEHWYGRAIDAGHTIAMYNLSQLLHEQGEHAKAEDWLRRAVDMGDFRAMSSLGVRLEKRGELTEAERLYRRAADIGDPRAMSSLGVLLQERGELTEAAEWLRNAANAGHDNAMFNLGVLLHEQGELTEAEDWYRSAADTNNIDAMVNLSLLLQIRGELAEAAEWLRRAADTGNTIAMVNLSLLLQRQGKQAEAAEWLRNADTHHPDVMFDLGLLLHERGELAEAEDWYRSAADTGDLSVIVNLGLLLQERGAQTEAEQWLRRAADTGYTIAMVNLSQLLHEQGKHTEADEWYRRATETSDTDGMCHLGTLLHERGDLIEAEQWYRRAADNGHTIAMVNLSQLLQEQGRQTEADEWLRKADSSNTPGKE